MEKNKGNLIDDIKDSIFSRKELLNACTLLIKNHTRIIKLADEHLKLFDNPKSIQNLDIIKRNSHTLMDNINYMKELYRCRKIRTGELKEFLRINNIKIYDTCKLFGVKLKTVKLKDLKNNNNS